jgi:hypothetical protein
MKKTNTKLQKNSEKPTDLRRFIEAIDGKAHYVLKPGDTARKMIKRSR